MKLIVYLFIFIVFTSFTKTLVPQRTLPELIARSNSIVIGKLNALTDTSLTFAIMEVIKGNPVSSVTIYKQQHAAYSTTKLLVNTVGQTELLFLDYDATTKTYELYTSDGVAEYLIKDSMVYLYGRTWYRKKKNESYPTEMISLDGNSVDAAGYRKTELCTAIRDYMSDGNSIAKKLFKEPDMIYIMEHRSPQKEEIVLKDKTLLRFSKKSRLHQRLIDELTDNPAVNIPMGYRSNF